MLDFVEWIYGENGEKFLIVGWSFGGVFVCEFVKMYLDIVCMVILLGSLISND